MAFKYNTFVGRTPEALHAGFKPRRGETIMGMTIAEKILAAHTGQTEVRPGEFVRPSLDFVFGHDVTGPLAIDLFYQAGGKTVFDPNRVAMIADHFVPNANLAAAGQAAVVRKFSADQGLPYFQEPGRNGICHALFPEQGLALPGDVIIGADSHTCTYGALGAFATGVGSTDLAAAMLSGKTWFKVPASMKIVYRGRRRPWVGGKDLILHTIGRLGLEGARYKVMEFTGPVIETLPMADRLTMCNMSIEAGAKAGLIAPDAITDEYVRTRAKRAYTFYQSDPDATYEETIDINVDDMQPQVACPSSPANVKSAGDVGPVVIQQAVIGSCTNGRLEDLRVAAEFFKDHRVHHDVRCIIIPATTEIYKSALREGLIEIFVEAGAVVGPPTCGPCMGGSLGVLAEGETALSTTNRNFVGRMGHPKSSVYLCSPAVAAAGAIMGRIVHPEEVV
jgi:3-isopropylmalate/(R)-2-methylmalate dehydratase large subunit